MVLLYLMTTKFELNTLEIVPQVEVDLTGALDALWGPEAEEVQEAEALAEAAAAAEVVSAALEEAEVSVAALAVEVLADTLNPETEAVVVMALPLLLKTNMGPVEVDLQATAVIVADHP